MRKNYTKHQQASEVQFAEIFNIRNAVKDFSPHAYSTSLTSQECTLSIKLFFPCRYLSFKPADTNDSSTNAMIENSYTSKKSQNYKNSRRISVFVI